MSVSDLSHEPAGTGQSRTSGSRGGAPVVVGIGASAGGLEAFRTFFEHMPARDDLAFVLVAHLAPEHPSLLTELLGRHTSLVVNDATDGTPVEGGHVYVIPPNTTLTIRDGALQLSHPAPPRHHRWPIDSFLASLAEDQGENAVGIILSGAGSDGARGLRAIKEHTGLTLAQAGSDHVALTGMPASAAATGLVDDVLPVDRMPARLVAHVEHLAATRDRKGPDGAREDLAQHLQSICSLLQSEVGHDFSQYKEKTLVRRIQRRMQVVQADTVEAYIDHLRSHPGEIERLFRELLIGVTEFFRDPEAFDVLQRQAIPALIADKGAADVVRVWVPGCATGEEAYSIAIALAEGLGQRRHGPKVQIFATDIDDRAIAAARAGRFRTPLPGVSPERLERWFIPDGDYYTVIKPIREMIVFSPHSTIKDPTFSRLDLISCRNLLIYLNADLQQQVLRTFHYALRPGGILMLGPSESLGRSAGLFGVIDKKHRLFLRRGDARPTLPITPPARTIGAEPASPGTPRASLEDMIDRCTRKTLERHAPASVVIDANHDVLRFYGDTGRYLGPSTGAASLNVFALLHKGLRGPARTAVQQALARQVAVVQEGQMLTNGGERVPVRLVAEPVRALDDSSRPPPNLCLLVFRDVPAAAPTAGDEAPARRPSRGDARRVQELELELASTREQLHTAIEELESANEEMKSANEEYQSVNEELQSSNEELETSKEEMQSINEELQTVNAELHSKNEVLARLNSDLQNLLESTQIATLFLDSALHVSGFTPAISDLFHLRESDRGRPITEITARIAYPELRQDVKLVLRTLAMVERVLHGGDGGAVYLMRMRPYRTTDNVIDGVVLTFIDITERQQHEYARGRLAAIVESSQDAIIGHGTDGVISSWNAGAERMFGYTSPRAIGQPLAMLLPGNEQDAMSRLLAASNSRAPSEELLMEWVRHDGTPVPVSVRCSPVLDPEGAVIGGSTIVRDITERRRAERRLDESEKRLAAIVEQATVGVAQSDLEGRIELANPRFCEITGSSASDLVGRRMLDLTHPDDATENARLFNALVADGTPFQIEKRYLRPDGSAVWVSNQVSLIHDDDGRPRGAVAVALDISQRRAAAEQRELLLSELNHRVKNTLATVQAIALQTLGSAQDLAAFRGAFLSRLMALAKTHNLLAREGWRGIGLRELLANELAPYATDPRRRAALEGDDIVLEPKAALAISLALHELATNAGKYGALSVADGGVDARWSVSPRKDDERPWLRLEWREHGGPPVAEPTRRGFGSRLITEGVSHELGGDAQLDFASTGVRCTIEFPLPRG